MRRGEVVLVATAGYDVNVYKSARNIADVTVSPVADLNALTVLRPSRLLITKAALDWMQTAGQRTATPKQSK